LFQIAKQEEERGDLILFMPSNNLRYENMKAVLREFEKTKNLSLSPIEPNVKRRAVLREFEKTKNLSLSPIEPNVKRRGGLQNV
jgi:hypothetical protein